ncbi:DegQ family serine endoprotease [soil metagenome]
MSTSFRRALGGAALLGALMLTAAPGCAQTPAIQRERRSALAEELAPAAREPRAATALQDAVSASRRTTIVQAAERVAPAVVSVNVLRRERVMPRSLFEQMLLPPGYQREVPGLGSGFIIHPDGLVLTNEHVVRGAGEVVVTLPDGRDFDAEVVGTDDLNDLAVVRIRFPQGQREPLPVAPLGDSDNLMIGEWAVAIGNPLGFLLSNTEPAVTAGVVSAVGRNIIPGGEEQRGYYLDMIQTDASINPGNSGGPLVNATGEVVGVNSSILSRGGGSEGLGFAIPINRARRIAVDLVENGSIRRAWIGAEVEPLQREGIRRSREVRIAQVVPGSPAARAGLREGMVVRGVGGKQVRTPLDWEAGLLQGRVGEAIEVRVAAGEQERAVRLVPEDLPSVSAERIRALRELELVTLTPAIRAERGLSNEQGALIISLSEQGRRIGLREGDLILQINRVRIRSAEEAARALQQTAEQGVVIYFERGGRIGSTAFRLG